MTTPDRSGVYTETPMPLLEPPIVQILRNPGNRDDGREFMYYTLRVQQNEPVAARDLLSGHPLLYVYLGEHMGEPQITLSPFTQSNPVWQSIQDGTYQGFTFNLGEVGQMISCLPNAQAWELALAHAHMFRIP